MPGERPGATEGVIPVCDLPAYSGSSVQCPKCQCHDVGATYYPDGVCNHAGPSETYIVRSGDGAGIERMHRACSKCGYAWDEAPADAKAEKHTPAEYHEAIVRELKCLWHDLYEAKRHAANGQWSIGCDGAAERIRLLTRLVGPTGWEKVQIDLLIDGTYDRLHREWGVEVEPYDAAVVQDMAARRQGETQTPAGR